MRLFNIKGKPVTKNVTKYIINWDGKSKSNLQFQAKQFLKPYWIGHIVYEEFPVYGTLLRVDILNATSRIAVEINGPQHSELHYFHNNEPFQYLDAVKRDVQKFEWLEKNNFQVVEINFDEVKKLTPQFFQDKFSITL